MVRRPVRRVPKKLWMHGAKTTLVTRNFRAKSRCPSWDLTKTFTPTSLPTSFSYSVVSALNSCVLRRCRLYRPKLPNRSSQPLRLTAKFQDLCPDDWSLNKSLSRKRSMLSRTWSLDWYIRLGVTQCRRRKKHWMGRVLLRANHVWSLVDAVVRSRRPCQTKMIWKKRRFLTPSIRIPT